MLTLTLTLSLTLTRGFERNERLRRFNVVRAPGEGPETVTLTLALALALTVALTLALTLSPTLPRHPEEPQQAECRGARSDHRARQ